MKKTIIAVMLAIAAALLAGCQLNPHQEQQLADALNTATQNFNDSYYQSQQNAIHQYNQQLQYRRNINCRSYRAGNSIRTNCW